MKFNEEFQLLFNYFQLKYTPIFVGIWPLFRHYSLRNMFCFDKEHICFMIIGTFCFGLRENKFSKVENFPRSYGTLCPPHGPDRSEPIGTNFRSIVAQKKIATIDRNFLK